MHLSIDFKQLFIKYSHYFLPFALENYVCMYLFNMNSTYISAPKVL